MVDIPLDSALIGAIIALFGSIILAILNTAILQPWIAGRARKKEKTRLREGLYSEMAYIYCKLTEEFESKYSPMNIKRDIIPTETYEYTREHIMDFILLKDSHAIETFYRSLKALPSFTTGSAGGPPDEIPGSVVATFLDQIDGGIVIGSNTLDLDLLERYASTDKCIERFEALKRSREWHRKELKEEYRKSEARRKKVKELVEEKYPHPISEAVRDDEGDE